MTEQSVVKWIWLSELCGGGRNTASELLAVYGSPEQVFDNRGDPKIAEIVGARRAAEIGRGLADRAVTIFEKCLDKGICPVPLVDRRYPALLAGLSSAPPVLYVTGQPDTLMRICVSGVGTRRMSAYGKQAAGEIFRPLARSGLCLVSGLAFGVDAEVHKAAVTEGGITIAVLGCPIDETAPTGHAELRRLIEQDGAVISEYPPMPREYNKATYPLRNRIIAGMSKVLAVVECSLRSGTMSTVNWALDFGREIFAVPGRITDEASVGCNSLISRGAAPLCSAGDILERYGIADVGRDTVKSQAEMSDEAAVVLTRLYNQPYTEEELSADLNIPGFRLMPILTELEVGGFIIKRNSRYEAF